MQKLGGYAGNILYVNLTDKSIKREPLSEYLVANFLGGTGINTRLAYGLIRPQTDPFSPENVMVFGVGPFVGTLVPGAGKSNIISKSPTSGLLGLSGTGHLGMLKFTGHDHLVISGRSDKPVYLKIRDHDVQFCDAGHIWGKDVFEATDTIWDEAGTELVIAGIGPAGENLVRDAGVIANKYSAFARTGLGAVMGSKNLKAVAVHGTRDISVADPARFGSLIKEVYEKFNALRGLDEWREYGTLTVLKGFTKMGLMPYKNFSESATEEVIEPFDLNIFLEKMKLGDIACMSCPIGCKHMMKLREGKYEGLTFGLSCLMSPMEFLGTCCGLNDWPVIAKCAELCNRLGLDSISTGTLIALAIELYQQGMIGKAETEGLELDWGNAGAILELVQQIAHRKAFGSVLADGFHGVANHLGERVYDYAIQAKGVAIPWDLRGARLCPDSLGQLTNARGGHPSFRGSILSFGSSERLKKFCQKLRIPPDITETIVENPDGNIGLLTKWAEDYIDVLESLGLCTHDPFQRIDIELWKDLYTSLTGIQTDVQALLKGAERIWDVKRAFNTREGATRKDDQAPKRFLQEPLKTESKSYDHLKQDHLEKQITRYYKARRWDPADGRVSRERLDELQMEKIC